MSVTTRIAMGPRPEDEILAGAFPKIRPPGPMSGTGGSEVDFEDDADADFGADPDFPDADEDFGEMPAEPTDDDFGATADDDFEATDPMSAPPPGPPPGPPTLRAPVNPPPSSMARRPPGPPGAAPTMPRAPNSPASTARPPGGATAPAAPPRRAPAARPTDDAQAWSVGPEDVVAFLKIMSLVALRVRGTQTRGIAETVVRSNYPAADRFVTEAGGDGAAFKAMLVNYGKAAVTTFAAEFAKGFRRAAKEHRMFSDIRTVPPKLRDLLDPVMTAVTNASSENAMALAAKRIGVLREPEIAKEFANFTLDTVGDLGSLGTDIESLVSQLTGAPAQRMTQQQIDAVKAENDPSALDMLKQYRKLRNDVAKRRQAEYKNIVLSSGRPWLPMNLFLRRCAQAGLPTDVFHPELADTAEIGMDTNANYVDSAGTLIVGGTGRPTGINPDYGLKINPDYQPGVKGKSWVAISISDAGTKNYLFGKDSVAGSMVNKFKKVALAIDGLDGAKAKWRTDVLGPADDNAPRKVLANLLEFMFITTCRPGTKEGMTKGARTYGAMNFLVGHVHEKGKGLLLRFPIKAGKLETYVLDPAAVAGPDKRAMTALVAFLKEKCRDKEATDVVFTVGPNRVKPNDLNAYIRAVGLPITAHKIRTARGTQLAKQLLDRVADEIRTAERTAGKKLDDKFVVEKFAEAMLQVGKLLSHVRRTKDGSEATTWLTAARSYVDPEYTMNWFADLKYRPPKQLSDAAAANAADDD